MVRLALYLLASALLTFISLGLWHSYVREPSEFVFERGPLNIGPPARVNSPREEFAFIAEESSATVVDDNHASTSAELSVAEAAHSETAVQQTVAEDSPQTTSLVQSPTMSPDSLNDMVRSSTVNILCEAASPLRSTSGSGVIIDQRGLILTNAHIAQYFLLENTSLSVSCSIRIGSPARSKWRAKLVYIPEAWVQKHAKDILLSRAMGTGEYDYAILAVTSSVDDEQLPSSFMFVPVNERSSTSHVGDPVLVSGYPAEFVGGSAARNTLYSSAVFSTIAQLLTFTDKVVDVVSVRGTALAQSGSSGGSFVNLYGSLVGLIVTTSIGQATDERDLHAITPEHISRSMREYIGVSLPTFLSQDWNTLLSQFDVSALRMSQLLLEEIAAQQY